MEMSGQLHTPAALPLGKSLQCVSAAEILYGINTRQIPLKSNAYDEVLT
jgi:hypothetical protein